ncbi:MAG: amidohydrolase [Vicinamibacterales bacterium]|nr:amidohydrolase [Vicinamibacterales bacterium]
MCIRLLPALTLSLAVLAATAATAQTVNPLAAEVDARVEKALPDIVEWRRDFHQHPELGNREFRTAKVIAAHLERLGLEVQTGVAHTGVVGLLKGGKPGPVVALRADMDGLPVTEQVDLPFKSTQKAMWGGQEVGVMHACGHDNHMAILLGVAEVLAPMRDRIPGSIKFIFQPAEEGPPEGEEGGAALMVKEGVLENPAVDAIFGLHVFPMHAGTIQYRSGPMMASADSFTIRVRGRQTHGAVPWGGVDPIVIGAQIVTSLQTIVSRYVNITEAPAVVTIGAFNGGNRFNIVPDEVVMEGTVRAFNETVRADIHRRIRAIAGSTAEASGGSVEVSFGIGYPSTINDPALTERMVPTLRRVAGAADVSVGPLTGTAEDFSVFQQQVPGMFFFLGVTPRDRDAATAPSNHSPLFFADESALPVGVRALANLALDYLHGQ